MSRTCAWVALVHESHKTFLAPHWMRGQEAWTRPHTIHSPSHQRLRSITRSGVEATCSRWGSYVTLGRFIYYNIELFYSSFASWRSFFLRLYLSGREVSKVRMRGVTTMGVDWSSEVCSEQAPDLVEPPLNLVLYMHLRIFSYTSNTDSHGQFRVDGLYTSLWYLKELQVFPSVLFIHWAWARDKTYLFYLPNHTPLSGMGIVCFIVTRKIFITVGQFRGLDFVSVWSILVGETS
jgi:hypothetical protein